MFLFLLPLIAGVLWLNFFHYGVDVKLDSSNVDVYASDLVDQCNSVTEGMSIYTIDGMISSRNKRAVWTIDGLKTVKYWIVNNVNSEHYPKGFVCSVEFDMSERAIKISLLDIED